MKFLATSRWYSKRFYVGVLFAVLAVTWMSWGWAKTPASIRSLHLPPMPSTASHIRKAIILGKRRSQDSSWLEEVCAKYNYTAFVYTIESPPEKGCLQTRSRSGREATVYLSYILDYYDSLPEYSVFAHAAPEQWHNDIVGPATKAILPHGPKTIDSLAQLRFEAVDAYGYVNLRCSHHPGCPVSLYPHRPEALDWAIMGARYSFAEIYMEIFGVPRDQVPDLIANICCAQFVVSRKQILARPRSDYEKMLLWAERTHRTNHHGVGWVFEKLWPIIFGKDAVHCPPVEQCRCDLYGWCGPLASGEQLQAVLA